MHMCICIRICIRICICIHTYAYSAGIYILRCPCISHSRYMLLPRPLAQPRRSGPRAHPCSPSRWRSARPTTGCGDTSCSRTLSRRRRTRPRAPHPTSSRSSRPRPRRGEAVGCCIVVVAETVDNLRREGLFSISSEVWANNGSLIESLNSMNQKKGRHDNAPDNTGE